MRVSLIKDAALTRDQYHTFHFKFRKSLVTQNYYSILPMNRLNLHEQYNVSGLASLFGQFLQGRMLSSMCGISSNFL